MAHKSKTQRAKASAARSARKEARIEAEKQETATPVVEETAEEKKSRFSLKKSESSKSPEAPKAEVAKKAEVKQDKPEKKPVKKKKRFQFFRDVKAEMKRVTWPTRTDVLRWSGVVVAALLFFGIYVAILDNGIMLPILVLISGIPNPFGM